MKAMTSPVLTKWSTFREETTTCMIDVSPTEIERIEESILILEDMYFGHGCPTLPSNDECQKAKLVIDNLEYLKKLIKCPIPPDDIFRYEIDWEDWKVDKRTYYSQSFREWLERVAQLWDSLTLKAAKMASQNQWMMDNVKAMQHQISYAQERGLDYAWWLDESLNSKVKNFFYYVPGREGASIRFDPLYVEKTLIWWNDNDNVIKAELTREELNDVIDGRVRYGLRGQLVEEPGYIMVWSNSAARWILWTRRYEKGEELKLDANMIYAPYDDYELLEQVIWLLKPLPLYAGSIEAKVKGHVEWEKADDLWIALMSATILEAGEREEHR